MTEISEEKRNITDEWKFNFALLSKVLQLTLNGFLTLPESALH